MEKEPTAEFAYKERVKRIKFLRKHGKTDPKAAVLAHRLESCESDQRCLSGACPECGRLFQRWFVRRSKKFIAKHISRPKHELVAVSVVPSDFLVRPGYLSALNMRNFIRREKVKLKNAGVDVALVESIFHSTRTMSKNICRFGATFLSDHIDCRQGHMKRNYTNCFPRPKKFPIQSRLNHSRTPHMTIIRAEDGF